MKSYSVRRYEVSTGHLILEHNHPPSSTAKEPASVPVDVNHVLEDVKAEDFRVGAWLNVLGYVRERDDDNRKGSARSSIYVEAVMVFSAGAVRVGEYERILRDSQEVDRRVRRPT